MKFILSKIPLSEYFSQYKIISLIIDKLSFLFFFSVRLVNRLFAYKEDSIVIISLHRLGDSIFTIPAIREIQKIYNKKITIVCYPESIPIYKLEFESIDNIGYCELNKSDFSFRKRLASFRGRKKIKSLKPSLIIDFLGSMLSASLIFNIRTQNITGNNNIFFRYLYDDYVQPRDSPQLIDIYLDIASKLVPRVNNERTTFKKNPESIRPEGYILVQPFAGWKEKEWPLNKFISIVKKLDIEYNVRLLVPDSSLFRDVIDEIKKSGIKIIITKTVDELIKIVKECSLFIGNDSGPVNIANFLGKPSFAIYGGTNPLYTASNEEHQVFTQKLLNCSAREEDKYCITHTSTYACSGVQCLNYLSVEEIYKQINLLTEKYCEKKLKDL